VRQHYSTEELVTMVRRSVEIFHRFDDEVGGESGFTNTGWAFLVPEDVSAGLSANLAMGQRLGVDVQEINKEDLLELEPRLELGDVHRIAYEPGSGYADPRATTHSYVRPADGRGPNHGGGDRQRSHRHRRCGKRRRALVRPAGLYGRCRAAAQGNAGRGDHLRH
jgi:glycine/D-amino acid oxidase-like deaminating enzyme